jgi:hypothetical protein
MHETRFHDAQDESETAARRIQPTRIRTTTRSQAMNRYPNPTPRAVPAIAAAALTAATLGLAVFLPATVDRAADEARIVSVVPLAAPAATEVAIVPSHIDVVGVRQPEVAANGVRDSRTRSAPAG